jgi:DNA-binding NtrC family response regulator
MVSSILDGKRLLLVDDEPDILTIVEEEILDACPNCRIDKAMNYEDASGLLKTKDYDLVVLDIMGVRGFDLLEIAIARKFRVAMLTAHALNPEALKKSHDMGAMAYLPKDKLGQIVPFLEDVFQYDYKTGWKRLLDKLESYFNARFDAKWKDKTGLPYWY